MEVAMFILPAMPELDQTAAAAAHERQAELTKPGSALAFHLIEGAVHTHNEMATFAEAGVSDKE